VVVFFFCGFSASKRKVPQYATGAFLLEV